MPYSTAIESIPGTIGSISLYVFVCENISKWQVESVSKCTMSNRLIAANLVFVIYGSHVNCFFQEVRKVMKHIMSDTESTWYKGGRCQERTNVDNRNISSRTGTARAASGATVVELIGTARVPSCGPASLPCPRLRTLFFPRTITLLHSRPWNLERRRL